MLFQKKIAGKPAKAKAHNPFAFAMRAAVRFPLQLPVTLNMGSTEVPALTVDVSSTGVLFSLEKELPVGTELEWVLRLPAEAMGTACDITVACRGRVVWVRDLKPIRMAVMIDQYQMKENAR